jgi:hypothetical protein
MKNNYLVILSSHVDSEDKKNKTIETLKHLNESNIDVCLSTHSNLYLDELSQYVKYVIYDDNNGFLILQDYIDNCKYIDDFKKHGFTSGSFFHSFGRVSITIPGSPHSKSALSLIKNGVMLSKLNDYRWTIYLEYDIKIPKLGFKHFFDYHIDCMIKTDKKCFYYRVETEDLKFLWGGPFFFETRPVFDNKKFMENDWYSNSQNWIKEWSLGFFESVINSTFDSSFRKNEIISENIGEKCENFWDVDNFNQIGEFNYTDSFLNQHKYLKKSFKINLYPHIDNNGNKKLFLYIYNDGDIKVDLIRILVYSNTVTYINEENKTINPEIWFFYPIDITKLSDDDIVILKWTTSAESEFYGDTQSIKIGDLEDIHKNVMNITFYQD